MAGAHRSLRYEPNPLKALIAGGGIGGLTAALCLHRIGWDIEVHEQTATHDATGAGIQISPNGCKVLAALGVLGALQARSVAPRQIELRHGNSGAPIMAMPLRQSAINRWGAPYLHVLRADLIDVLLGALNDARPDAILFGSKVIGYELCPDKVIVRTNRVAAADADLLIGADGIHSSVRRQMHGNDEASFTGNVAWRATVPIDQLGAYAPPSSACVWVGAGRHAVTYRLRGGELANFVGVVEQRNWHHESWTERGSREEALADFAGWDPIVTTLIERADEHYRWALFDRRPLPSWSDHRVVLLGDACHPMLPFLAQGAVMAMEDAWLLAARLATLPRSLSRSRCELTGTLAKYYSCRINRTSKVQRKARANMALFHRHTRLSRWLTYAPLSVVARWHPSFLHARQDWLYGYDVTRL